MSQSLPVPDSQRPEALVLSVVTGDAVPRARTLYRGQRIDSLTLGTRGDWRVDAPGVIAIHAALHFDGNTLYVWASPLGASSVNGKPAPESWTAVTFPAVLLFGEARIVLLGPRTKAARRSLPPVSAPPKATVRPWEAASAEADGGATRLVDIESLLPSAERTAPAARSLPAVVSPASLASPAERPASSAAQNAALRSEEPTLRRRIPASALALWRGVPFTTRIASAVLVLGAGMFLLPSGARGARDPIASTSASAPAAVAGSASARAPAVVTPESLPTVAAMPAPPPSGTAVRATSGPTEQWRAVDAVVSGNNAEAVRRYEELTRSQPDSMPYREALRILRQSNR